MSRGMYGKDNKFKKRKGPQAKLVDIRQRRGDRLESDLVRRGAPRPVVAEIVGRYQDRISAKTQREGRLLEIKNDISAMGIYRYQKSQRRIGWTEDNIARLPQAFRDIFDPASWG